MAPGLATLCLDAAEVRSRAANEVGDDGMTDAEREDVARNHWLAVQPDAADAAVVAEWLRRKRSGAELV